MQSYRNYWGALDVPPHLDAAGIDALLVQLVAKDEEWIRRNPQTPWFYEAGIPYRRDPPGGDKWLPIPGVLAQGHADCKSMAAWRVAELRVKGDKYRDARGNVVRTGPEAAKAFWVDGRTEKSLGPGQYHVRLRRGDGRIEDPSVMMGMYGAVQVMRAPWMAATHSFR